MDGVDECQSQITRNREYLLLLWRIFTLEIQDVPVSVPVIRYLSPANVSRLGGSVSVSCESLQGSLPIQYRWYEQTSSGHPKISDTNELALHCQSFNQQHHQYYCSASNWHGARSSAMVNVAVFNNGEICSYVTEINGTNPVSVPLLRFSPPSGSSCADSVSVSCESVHGSLPIQYSWYEKTPSVDSKISDTNKLDLHCQSIKYKNHLYYCKASNTKGEKSSEVVNVSISNSVSTCRNVIEVNSMGPIHFCENAVTQFMTTAQREESSSYKIYMIWNMGRWLFFALLGICTIAVTSFTRDKKRSDQSDPHRLVQEKKRRIPDFTDRGGVLHQE
ncbi:Fc receptor-like protein 5 [Mobula birostris]|uniref:Fc receptor-like protein 5 n=1 Tax=Mobula birostris TaxID=1983395 RepID=UPI003B28DB09